MATQLEISTPVAGSFASRWDRPPTSSRPLPAIPTQQSQHQSQPFQQQRSSNTCVGSSPQSVILSANGSFDQAADPPPQGGSPTPGMSTSSAASSIRKSASEEQNKVEPLIVFDWDDTILASSWIQVRELLQAGSYEDLPSEARRDLAHLEQSVIECLTNARRLGTVIIITNAESGWVELSAAKFFVNLLPLLEGVPVVSARSLFEAQFPGSPLCWKSAAFAYMMHEHFLDRPRWVQKKVVSIGDSNEEKVAMRIASVQHSTMAAKAVKFITGPDPEALACQLDFVTQQLSSIVSSDTDVDIVLDATMISGALCLPLHSRGVYDGEQHPQASADGDVSLSPPHDHIGSEAESQGATHIPSADDALASRASRVRNSTQQDSFCRATPPPSASLPASRQQHPCMTSDGRPSSSPILIPGDHKRSHPKTTAARGADEGGGGGDCVQPFHSSPVEANGSRLSTPFLSYNPSTEDGAENSKGPRVSHEDACCGARVGGGDACSDGVGACGGSTCPTDNRSHAEFEAGKRSAFGRRNELSFIVDGSDAGDGVPSVYEGRPDGFHVTVIKPAPIA